MEKVLAVLWDGHNKLNGEVALTIDGIEFSLISFNKSDLNLNIRFVDMISAQYETIYGLDILGVNIRTQNGTENIFIINNPIDLINRINKNLKTVKK